MGIKLEGILTIIIFCRLLEILSNIREKERTLIFCDTKKMVDELEKTLKNSSFPVVAIHGDKRQLEREKSLSEFKNGNSYILVATDVASRGLDVKDIKNVINFDFPLQVEDYVHRIGRTARAGAKGDAYSFFTKKDFGLAPELVKVLDEAGQEAPPELLDLAELAKSTESTNVFRKWKVNENIGNKVTQNEEQKLIPDFKIEQPKIAENKSEIPKEIEKSSEIISIIKEKEEIKKPMIEPKKFENFFGLIAKQPENNSQNKAAGPPKKWGKK